jgi:hypothetical protein
MTESYLGYTAAAMAAKQKIKYAKAYIDCVTHTSAWVREAYIMEALEMADRKMAQAALQLTCPYAHKGMLEEAVEYAARAAANVAGTLCRRAGPEAAAAAMAVIREQVRKA